MDREMGKVAAVFGIDPAPKKDAVICTGEDSFESVAATDLPSYVEQLLSEKEHLLIAWDAPLIFAPNDFYDRLIDKAARECVKQLVVQGVLAHGAVNVRPFAGLPHWAVTCESLGYPFGHPPGCLKLVTRPNAAQMVIEVHPAVALAVWWVDKNIPEPMPQYKGDRHSFEKISELLGFPETTKRSDDHLDAYVAYRLGKEFLSGNAVFVGNQLAGGYVLPRGIVSSRIAACVEQGGSKK